MLRIAFLFSAAVGVSAQSFLGAASNYPSLFQQPETQVESSPGEFRKLDLPPGETLMDFAMSPAGPEVAILTIPAGGHAHVLIWKISSGESQTIWESDGAFTPRAIAWHPAARTLFLLGSSGAEWLIERLESMPTGWKAEAIYRTKRKLNRLIIGPRPFSTSSEYGSSGFYRLFFGVARGDGTSLIASVTERGDRYYEVTKSQAAPPFAPLEKDGVPPEQFTSESALPEAFHPAGHIMLWVDRMGCFQSAHYGDLNWDKSNPVWGGTLCGGSVEPTPNGIGLLHWHKSMQGADLLLSNREQPVQIATEHNFISVPLATPDGRGLVGATMQGKALNMVYVPVDIPLANVSNAWMFVESQNDRTLFGENAGLFRTLDKDNQLYELYDSEAYACSGYYSENIPTRPYLVTTDIVFENFAAAYEGLFILLERRQAIPIFWLFVREANAGLANSNSPWALVFHALAQLESPNPDDPEAQRILRASGVERSSVLERNFNFGDLKPRGHYTASEQERRYFKAFRYLTTISSMPDGLQASELSSLPPMAQEHARIWIRTYLPFIAPSRSSLVWNGLPSSAPEYARHPSTLPSLFPLSWGFDNEVMLSTVYHHDWQPAEQIAGPDGMRLLPSGLDVAAALGNSLARTLLEPEIQKYPPLAKALDDLKARAPAGNSPKSGNLYDRWIEALGTSWADSSIPGVKNAKLWDAKRLQTGLASWATLRHATVLVNEHTAAECGEGGFEYIKLTPPRGYVEPSPDTFEAIAGLFDAATNVVRTSPALEGGKAPAYPEKAVSPEEADKENLALREGLLRRLGEAAAKARRFAEIARKELKGQALSEDDYVEILWVGRAAEYHFKIFKSLANPEFALSDPDPMPKIADVAGGANGIPYLHVAVGAPLEWDQIVPYFGRREIVRGSVYSYYEFPSAQPLTDTEWRSRLASQARPVWVSPFISKENLSCPAKDPY